MSAIYFKTYFGSCVFFFISGGGGGGSSECQDTRFFRGVFLFLCVFTSGVFQTLLYIGRIIWQQSNWLKLVNVSNRSVSCRKIIEKVEKGFAEGVFLCVVRRIFFLARAAKNCLKNMPAKFQGCAIFVPGVFFHKKVAQRLLTDIPLLFPLWRGLNGFDDFFTAKCVPFQTIPGIGQV